MTDTDWRYVDACISRELRDWTGDCYRDDIAQVARIAAHDAETTWDSSRSSWRTYVSRVVFWAVSNEIKRIRKKTASINRCDRLDSAASGECDAVDTGGLLDAVEALPPKERALIIGHYWLGLPLKDIGARWGVGRNMASKVHRMALDALRAVL